MFASPQPMRIERPRPIPSRARNSERSQRFGECLTRCFVSSQSSSLRQRFDCPLWRSQSLSFQSQLGVLLNQLVELIMLPRNLPPVREAFFFQSHPHDRNHHRQNNCRTKSKVHIFRAIGCRGRFRPAEPDWRLSASAGFGQFSDYSGQANGRGSGSRSFPRGSCGPNGFRRSR